MMKALGIVLAVGVLAVVLVIGWFVTVNNQLVSLQEAMRSQWARSTPCCSGVSTSFRILSIR